MGVQKDRFQRVERGFEPSRLSVAQASQAYESVIPVACRRLPLRESQPQFDRADKRSVEKESPLGATGS